MTQKPLLSKDEHLRKIQAGWDDLHSYLASLDYVQVVVPSDAAGWTALDHLVHLAIWEDSINALYEGVPRWERMGVDRELFESRDWDAINAVIRQRNQELTIDELQPLWFGIHQRLVDKIKAMSEDELNRPYKEYQPGSDEDRPASHWIAGDTYEHYAEHKEWIAEIVKQEVGKDALLTEIEKGWNVLNAFLSGLTDAQIAVPTDAGGWTIKDHLAHLAVWEDGVNALLARENRRERMQIDEATWATGDDDKINEVIYARVRDMPLDAVQKLFRSVHEELIEKINALSDDELRSPFRIFNPNSTSDRQVMGAVVGSTFAHYYTHIPWMRAIAEKSA